MSSTAGQYIFTFLAAPRLAAVVVFLAGAVFLPARTFFGGAALALVAAVLAADDLLAAAAALDVPADDLAAVEVAVVLGLGAVFFTVVAFVVAVLAVFGFATTLGLGAGLFCLPSQRRFRRGSSETALLSPPMSHAWRF
jgi:hypothetical protein